MCVVSGWLSYTEYLQQMEKSRIVYVEKPSPVCKPRGSQPSRIQTK